MGLFAGFDFESFCRFRDRHPLSHCGPFSIPLFLSRGCRQIQERRKHIYSHWAYGAECDGVEALTLGLLSAIGSLYSSGTALPGDATAVILRKIEDLLREYTVRQRQVLLMWVFVGLYLLDS